MEEVYIYRLELQRLSLDLLFPFLKIYIWNLGLRFFKFLLGP
jgi:hypothetical protein